MNLLKTYLACLVTFFICDGIWLGFVARGFYRRQLGSLLAERVIWPAAIAFYLLFVAGAVFFVVRPAVERGSIAWLLIASAFYGLCTYGTYDLTNWALARNWPWLVSIVDMAWGVAVSAIVSMAGYLVWSRTMVSH